MSPEFYDFRVETLLINRATKNYEGYTRNKTKMKEKIYESGCEKE